MSKWPYSTAAWQRLREAKLSASPLCEACIRRDVVEVATVVDHILAIEKGGEAFPPLAGLMSMCAPCHNVKTRAVDSADSSGFRRAYAGFDLDGNPIDPDGWATGAFRGREVHHAGPPAPSNSDLVSCEPFATGEKEAPLWV